MKSIKLKVELCGVKSVRHVVVPENITLAALHEVVQALFAWENEHLWGFRASNGTLWEFQSDDEATIFRPPAHSPDETCVGTVFPKKGAHLEYTYDFGDNWLHRITRMTDPKEGVAFACVKVSGPDGAEDCGGFPGLDGRDRHVPSLDEVNRRLPKKLKTCEYVPPVNADNPDALTLRDVVSSKSMDGLSQIGADGGRKLTREKCIDRSLKLIEEHPETLKLFLCGLCDKHYRVMTDALTKGVGQLDFPSTNEIGIFEGYPFVFLEQYRRTRYRVVAPVELRGIWQEHCIEWGLAHQRWNEIERFASAAVRLYGSLGIGEFVTLLKQYEVPGPLLEECVAYLLDVRSYSGYATYAVVENELRLMDFDEENVLNEGLGHYADFRDKRADVPRNTALSRDEFLAYADDGYVEDVEPVRTLLAFLSKKVGKLHSADFVMKEIVGDLVLGDEPGEIVVSLPKYALPDREKYSEKLRMLITDVRHAIRLPIYNGHAYDDAYRDRADAGE